MKSSPIYSVIILGVASVVESLRNSRHFVTDLNLECLRTVVDVLASLFVMCLHYNHQFQVSDAGG
jgi:hypothetical protein